MGDSFSLTEFLVCCVLLLALALYICCRWCAKLERENRVLRYFFEQRTQMDTECRRAYQAMSVEAARAKAQTTATTKSKTRPSSMV